MPRLSLSRNCRTIGSCVSIFIIVAMLAGCGCILGPGMPRKGKPQVGLASWYGPKYQGRKTANGETFDMNKVSAAHKKLPLGSVVKVTNLKNGKTLIVRINDRGPYIRGRIIDLSRAAAEKLDMMKDGVVKVRVELIN